MSKLTKVAALGTAAVSALMPVTAVFATVTGSFTDTIDVTIDDACTLTRGTTAHEPGDGDTARGTWSTDLLSGNLAAGEYDQDYGSSNFNVVCNHKAGWKVTAAATALAGKTTTGEYIPLGTPGIDTAAWNYTSSTSDEGITGVGTYSAASQIVAQSVATTDINGRNFSVKYAVSVNHELSAQTYEGTIAYTLAEL